MSTVQITLLGVPVLRSVPGHPMVSRTDLEEIITPGERERDREKETERRRQRERESERNVIKL